MQIINATVQVRFFHSAKTGNPRKCLFNVSTRGVNIFTFVNDGFWFPKALLSRTTCAGLLIIGHVLKFHQKQDITTSEVHQHA